MTKRFGFTLAEVLITLVVIGIVAAITVPILRQSTGDKEYDAARKKVLTTIGQAGRQMAMNGELTLASNADTFVNQYLSKYVKIAKTCGTDLEDCGLSDQITRLDDNEKLSMPKTIGQLSSLKEDNSNFNGNNITSYGLVLSNGYAINLFYYPGCTKLGPYMNYVRNEVCINAIYDINGKSKPNKVGKDIGFVTFLYTDAGNITVAPKPYKTDAKSAKYNDAEASCNEIDKNLFLPSREEFLSMNYNNNLIGEMNKSNWYWSATEYAQNPSGYAWAFAPEGTRYYYYPKSISLNIRCIYR